MEAHNGGSGPQHPETRTNSSRTKGVFEMKIASQRESAKVSLWQGLQFTVPAKLLGGLALGAMLVTATFLPVGSAQASPLAEPPVEAVAVDIEDEGGTGRLFEPWELGQGTNLYVNHSKPSRVGVLATPLVIVEPMVDIEDEGGTGRMFEPYELVQPLVDIEDEGGIGRMFEAYELAQPLVDIEDEGGTGRMFEAYELVQPLVDIEDEGGTGRMFEPWEYSNRAGENEQADIFPEVEL